MQDSDREVLEKRIAEFKEKAHELNEVFKEIDLISSAVSGVSSNLQQVLNWLQTDLDTYLQIEVYYQSFKFSDFSSTQCFQLEVAADAIDKQIDTSPLKKMFGFFKPQKVLDQIPIPTIFEADEMFSKRNSVPQSDT